MKKMYYLVIGVLLLLSSCSEEKDSLIPDDGKQAKGQLTFEVGLPSGDPVTYAIQTDAEKLVERLDIYQFEGTTDTDKLDGVYKDVSLTASATGYNVNVVLEGGLGNKQFFFVANNIGKNNGGVSSIENLPLGSIDAGTFKKAVTKALSSTKGLATPLLMVANLPSVTVTASTPNQTVTLERIMSRIDIKNFEPLLTVTRVRLENVLDRSYMLHQATGSQKPAGATLITLPEATLPASVTPAGSNAPIEYNKMPASGGFGAYDYYKHVFYPTISEAVTSEATAPMLIIEGTLFKGDVNRETKVVYRKALKVEGQTNFLGFKRNTRYTFVIERAIKGDLEATLKTDQWNEDTVDAPLTVKVPTPTGFYDQWNYNNGEGAFVGGVLTLRKDITSGVILSMNVNTEWEVFPEGATSVPVDGQMAPWIKAVPTNTYWGNTYDKHIVERGLQLNLLANNTTADREIRLILRSKADNNKQYILTVKQTH